MCLRVPENIRGAGDIPENQIFIPAGSVANRLGESAKAGGPLNWYPVMSERKSRGYRPVN
jgi:hypothetical protein